MSQQRYTHVINTLCLCCSVREDVVTKEESSSWRDLSKGGTIPTAASLRVPPARIGLSTKQNVFQGLNSQEVSKRYLLKLQRERERTNKAVSRSLDNLPIKIKKMSKDHTDADLIQNEIMNVYKDGVYTFRSQRYHLGLGTKYDVCDTPNHLFQAMPINSLCKHTKRNCTKCHKQFRGRRTTKRDEKDSIDSKTVATDTDTRTSGYDSDFDILLSQRGDQSMRSEVSLLNGFPVRVQQTSESEISKDLNNFQNRYQKVFDANRNVHYVHSSLVNKRVKRLKNLNSRPRLKSTYVPTEEYSLEMMNIRSVQHQSLQKYSRNTPFCPIAPPQSRISETTDYQAPHYHLSDYSYSDDNDDEFDEDSYVPVNSPENPDIPRLHLEDDYNDSGDEDDDKETNSNSWSSSTQLYGQKLTTVSDDLNHSEESDDFIPLSVSALKLHNAGKNTTTKPMSRNFPQVCNLTDITEREESNLTRSTKSKVVSETPADVRMSIRIAYKGGGDDVIRELSNISSEEIMVPRWSRQEIDYEVIEENTNAENRESGLSRNSSETRHRVLKGLHTGYTNMYQESMRDIAETIDAAQQAMDFIDQTLASSDSRVDNAPAASPDNGDLPSSGKTLEADKASKDDDDKYLRADQEVTGIDKHLKSLEIESPQFAAFNTCPDKDKDRSHGTMQSTLLTDNSADKQHSGHFIDEEKLSGRRIAEKNAFFVTASNENN
ncbi:uncharacterized protein LOC125654930 isoform X2 [Ostrea edulis]|uniref:uncharacterized protein LOC125654930 isoform X2 n=1 Tax=Ostrea edulis TaxID=37623 RepID=UPI0024AE9912|nr:uncharacterized protein LOC125654930 isoform X2 [Ostrea edulis]